MANSTAKSLTSPMISFCSTRIRGTAGSTATSRSNSSASTCRKRSNANLLARAKIVPSQAHADGESASEEETVIKIHHLNHSRSTRVIWLMEELNEPYEIVQHMRDPKTFRSPQTLERVHPLGKAPVIEDGALMLAESGAIIEYLVSTYGRGKLAPAPGGSSWARYIELLHFAEGSAMFPLLV